MDKFSTPPRPVRPARQSSSESIAAAASAHSGTASAPDALFPVFRGRHSDASGHAVAASNADLSLSATVMIAPHSYSSSATAVVHYTPVDGLLIFGGMSRGASPFHRVRRAGGGVGDHSSMDQRTRASESDGGSVIVHQTPIGGAVTPRWGELLGGARGARGTDHRRGRTVGSEDDDKGGVGLYDDSDDDDGGAARSDMGSNSGAHAVLRAPHPMKTKRRRKKRVRREPPGAPMASLQPSRKGPETLRERLILEQRLLARRQRALQAQRLQHQLPVGERPQGEGLTSGEETGGAPPREGSFSPSPDRPSADGGAASHGVRASLIGPAGVPPKAADGGALFFHIHREFPIDDGALSSEPEAVQWPPFYTIIGHPFLSSHVYEMPPRLSAPSQVWRSKDSPQPISTLTSPPNPALLSTRESTSLANGSLIVGSLRAPFMSGGPGEQSNGSLADNIAAAAALANEPSSWLRANSRPEPVPLTNLFFQGSVAVTAEEAFTYVPAARFDTLQRRSTGALFDVFNSSVSAPTAAVAPPGMTHQTSAYPGGRSARALTASSRSTSPVAHVGEEAEQGVHATRDQSCDATQTLLTSSLARSALVAPLSSRGLAGDEHDARAASARCESGERREKGHRPRRRMTSASASRRDSHTTNNASNTRATSRSSLNPLHSSLGASLKGSFSTSAADGARSRKVSVSRADEALPGADFPAGAMRASGGVTSVLSARAQTASTMKAGVSLQVSTTTPLDGASFDDAGQYMARVHANGAIRPPRKGRGGVSVRSLQMTMEAVDRNVRQWTTLTTGTLMEAAPRHAAAFASGKSAGGVDGSQTSSVKSTALAATTGGLSGAIVPRRSPDTRLTVRVFTVTAGELLNMIQQMHAWWSDGRCQAPPARAAQTAVAPMRTGAVRHNAQGGKADPERKLMAVSTPAPERVLVSGSETPSLLSSEFNWGVDESEGSPAVKNATGEKPSKSHARRALRRRHASSSSSSASSSLSCTASRDWSSDDSTRRDNLGGLDYSGESDNGAARTDTWRLSQFATLHARSLTNQPGTSAVVEHTSPRTTGRLSTPTTTNHRYAKSFIHGTHQRTPAAPPILTAPRDVRDSTEGGRHISPPNTVRTSVQQDSASPSMDEPTKPAKPSCDDLDNKGHKAAEQSEGDEVRDTRGASPGAGWLPPVIEQFDGLFLSHLEKRLREFLGIAGHTPMPPAGVCHAEDRAVAPATPAPHLADQSAPLESATSPLYLTLPALGLQLQMMPYSLFAPQATRHRSADVASRMSLRGSLVRSGEHRRSDTCAPHGSTSGLTFSAAAAHHGTAPPPDSAPPSLPHIDRSPTKKQRTPAREHSCFAADTTRAEKEGRLYPVDAHASPAPHHTTHSPTEVLAARYGALTPSSIDGNVFQHASDSDSGEEPIASSESRERLPEFLPSTSPICTEGVSLSSPCATAAPLIAAAPPPVPADTPVLAVAVAFPTIPYGNVRDAFQKWVSETAATPVEREFIIRNIIRGVLTRLTALHATGCAHGSVKSTNIFAVAHAAEALTATSQDATGTIAMAAVQSSVTPVCVQDPSAAQASPTSPHASSSAATAVVGVPRYTTAFATRHKRSSRQGVREVHGDSPKQEKGPHSDASDAPTDDALTHTPATSQEREQGDAAQASLPSVFVSPISSASPTFRPHAQQSSSLPGTPAAETPASTTDNDLPQRGHGALPAPSPIEHASSCRAQPAATATPFTAHPCGTSGVSSPGTSVTTPPPTVEIDVDGASDIFRWSTDVILVDEMYGTVEYAVRRAMMDVMAAALAHVPLSGEAFEFPVSSRSSSYSTPLSTELATPSAAGASTPALDRVLPRSTHPTAATPPEQWLHMCARRTNLFPLLQAEHIPPPECIVDEQTIEEQSSEMEDDEGEREEDVAKAQTLGTLDMSATERSRNAMLAATGNARSADEALPPPLPPYPYRLHSFNTYQPVHLRSLAADVWMLGMLAIELADGAASGEKLRHAPRPSLRYRPWSSHFAGFVRQCLTVDPSQRPSCAQLLEDPWFKVTLVATTTAATSNIYGERERVLSVLQPPRGCSAGGLVRLTRPSVAAAQAHQVDPVAAAAGARHGDSLTPRRLYLHTTGDICRQFRRHALTWLRSTLASAQEKKQATGRGSNSKSTATDSGPAGRRGEPAVRDVGRSSTCVSFVEDGTKEPAGPTTHGGFSETKKITSCDSGSNCSLGRSGSPFSANTSTPHNALLSTQLLTAVKAFSSDSVTDTHLSPEPSLAREGGAVRPSSGTDEDGEDSSSHNSLMNTLPMANNNLNIFDIAAVQSEGDGKMAMASPAAALSCSEATHTGANATRAAVSPRSSSASSSISAFDMPSSEWTSSDDDTERDTKRNVGAAARQPVKAGRSRGGGGGGGQAKTATQLVPPITLSAVTAALELCRRQAQLEGQLLRRPSGAAWSSAAANAFMASASTGAVVATAGSASAARRVSSDNTSLVFGSTMSALTGSVGAGRGETPPHFGALSLTTPGAGPRRRSNSLQMGNSGASLTAWPVVGATTTATPGSPSLHDHSSSSRHQHSPPRRRSEPHPRRSDAPDSPTSSRVSMESSFFLYSDDEEAVTAEVAALGEETVRRKMEPDREHAHDHTKSPARAHTLEKENCTEAFASAAVRSGEHMEGVHFECPPPLQLRFGEPDEDEDVLDASESEKQLTNLLQAFLSLYWKYPLAADAWAFQILRHLSRDTRTTELATELETLLSPSLSVSTTASPHCGSVTPGRGDDAEGHPTTVETAAVHTAPSLSASPPPPKVGSGTSVAAPTPVETTPSLFNAFEVAKWMVSSTAALEKAKERHKSVAAQ